MLDRRSLFAVLAIIAGVSIGAISTAETARGDQVQIEELSLEARAGKLDGLLMFVLGAAAVAFQTRRAYEAARRRSYQIKSGSDPMEQS